ncbi:MAG: serine/threonine-protein kinase, partial [Polyangiaceae bacterium]
GCSEDRGVPYLAMEYLEGGSLRDIAKQCQKKGVRLTADLVVFIACEILKGLHHAHTLRDYDGRALSFVHRDLSPHNVVVTSEGWVKVIDFGIAKTTLQNEKTAAGIVKGKCAYVSPEQVVGDPLDARTNIFSLGIVMWELLTGRRLMDGSSTYEVMTRVLNRASPPPSSVVKHLPAGLDAIVQKALARDPNERFDSAEAMRKALRSAACLGGKPMATAEDLASVMSVLFGAERKARTESIQSKMAALGAGKRASDSGQVPRMSSADIVPAPPTSSIRLCRDVTRTDEQETKVESKKTPTPADFDLAARATELDLAEEYELRTRFERDFVVPVEAIREDCRAKTPSAVLAVRTPSSATWQTACPTRTEPKPERVASFPPPPVPVPPPSIPSPVPSVPVPSTIDSTGPMIAAVAVPKGRFVRHAFSLLVDGVAVALVVSIGLRVTGHPVPKLDALRDQGVHAAHVTSSWVGSKLRR